MAPLSERLRAAPGTSCRRSVFRAGAAASAGLPGPKPCRLGQGPGDSPTKPASDGALKLKNRNGAHLAWKEAAPPTDRADHGGLACAAARRPSGTSGAMIRPQQRACTTPQLHAPPPPRLGRPSRTRAGAAGIRGGQQRVEGRHTRDNEDPRSLEPSRSYPANTKFSRRTRSPFRSLKYSLQTWSYTKWMFELLHADTCPNLLMLEALSILSMRDATTTLLPYI